jgi:hypothetical protein
LRLFVDVVDKFYPPPPGVTMPVPRSAVFAVVAALLVCAGCVPTTPPGPLPQATPSWSCTPVAGGTPYPCYEHDYQEAAAQNKLYDQAEAVFRKFIAEDERIQRAGGVERPTAILDETLTGEALASVMANYADLMSDGTKMVGGEFRVVSVQRLLPSQASSVAALRVCLDLSEVELKAFGQKSYRLDEDGVETFYFMNVGTALKIGEATSKWVESC